MRIGPNSRGQPPQVLRAGKRDGSLETNRRSEYSEGFKVVYDSHGYQRGNNPRYRSRSVPDLFVFSGGPKPPNLLNISNKHTEGAKTLRAGARLSSWFRSCASLSRIGDDAPKSQARSRQPRTASSMHVLLGLVTPNAVTVKSLTRSMPNTGHPRTERTRNRVTKNIVQDMAV